MVLWPIRARVLFELFYKGLYCLYNKIMIILTRRALTKAESKKENSNFPITVMLFNATVFDMKINKPTPRNVTQFVTD